MCLCWLAISGIGVERVEVNYWNKLKVNIAYCCFIFYGYITMHGQQNIRENTWLQLHIYFFILHSVYWNSCRPNFVEVACATEDFEQACYVVFGVCPSINFSFPPPPQIWVSLRGGFSPAVWFSPSFSPCVLAATVVYDLGLLQAMGLPKLIFLVS